MTSSKRKLFGTIAIVALFIIGFTFGAIFGNARINRKKVPQGMAIAITYMDSRISEMHNNAALTVEAVDGIIDFKADSQQMEIVSFQTSKSYVYSQTAVGAAERLLDGDKVDMSEKIFNRQVLSYMMTDIYTSIIKGFITDADTFLEGKNVDDYLAIAFVRDLWVDYLLMDAVLKGSSEMMMFWSENGHLLSDDMAKACFAKLPAEIKGIISSSYCMDRFIVSLNGRYAKDGSLDDAASAISGRTSLFANAPVEFPLVSLDSFSACDTLKVDNNYLYSIAVVATSK